jgi:hypothetical protein
MTQTTLRPIRHRAARTSDNVPMDRRPRPIAHDGPFGLAVALLITALGLVGALLLIGLPILRLVGVL